MRHTKAILLIAFLCLIHGNLIMGARRICHDTYVFCYPWRVYLSDSLHQGSFPFWDPFSSPGFSTSNFLNGILSPIVILFGTLWDYTPDIFTLEIVILGVIGLSGSYGWLRRQGISKPLAIGGAFAYIGSSPIAHGITCFNQYVSMIFFPWMMTAFDFWASKKAPREHWQGTALMILSSLIMITGGHMGVNYVAFAIGLSFGIGKMIFERSFVWATVSHGFAAVFVVVLLLFIPLSEFAPMLSQAKALRGFSSQEECFQGCLELSAFLTPWLSNGSYLPGLTAGYGQLYMGIVPVFSVLAGLLTTRPKRLDWLFLGLAILILLASMNRHSPVAWVFAQYYPGWAWFRWHASYGVFAILLLITMGLRMLEQALWNIQGNSSAYRRFAAHCIWVGLAVAAIAMGIMRFTEPANPLTLSYFDVADITLFTLLLAILLGMWFFSSNRTKYAPDLKNVSIVFACSIIALTCLGLIIVRFTPNTFALSIANQLLTDDKALALVGQYGLQGLIEAADRRFVSIAPKTLFFMDIAQAGAIVVLFLGLIKRVSSQNLDRIKWCITILIFCDMTLGWHRYQHGSAYWKTSQCSIAESYTSPRPTPAPYRKNYRNPNYGHRFAPTWNITGGYVNIALLWRVPTFLSYGPFFNVNTVNLMKQPGNEQLFHKLIWWAPSDKVITADNWNSVLIEPDIRDLQLTPNTFTVTIQAPQPGCLVWMDSWNPGWQVLINNRPAELQKVLGTVKGVDVPQGLSDIVFRYYPVLLRQGLGFFCLGFAGLLLVVIQAVRGRFRSPDWSDMS